MNTDSTAVLLIEDNPADAADYITVIVLSGLNDETISLEAVQKGAQDYLVKGQVDS